jgi:peptidoglycan/LPS O-acetylase OafA/YrhL
VALHLESNVNGMGGLSHGQLPGKMALLSQFLLVQNLVHVKSIVNVLWSLPFEVQMYVFLPFLFTWARRKRILWPLLVLWIVSLLAAWVQPRVAALNRASLLLFVPCFLPGVIAFTLPRTPRLSSYLWPVFILALVVAFANHPELPMGWVLCLVLGLLLPFFREIQSKPILRSAIASRPTPMASTCHTSFPSGSRWEFLPRGQSGCALEFSPSC